MPDLPQSIGSVSELEELLSRPPDYVIEALERVPGDVIVLGAAGKMGPTLARMAKRAVPYRRVIAVSRFSSDGSEDSLRANGVETLRAHLLDRDSVNELPDAPNVVYMAGMKFGSAGQEPLTWAMNAWLPGIVCERYPNSRIVAFSTGNVYPLTPVDHGGSIETDPPGPLGEYAMSCLGRERIFEHFSNVSGTNVLILRLNYAVEMRYGVLVDIGFKVLNGEPIALTMGYFNAIWQGDANAMALAALPHATSPATILNVAGPQTLSVRKCAERFGELMARTPNFIGTESPDALLSNSARAQELFGTPTVSADRMMLWIADWLQRGGGTLDRPTHFEMRDGKF